MEGAQKSSEELNAAYHDKDSDKLGRTAHRMLPMLRQMRANHLIPILVKIEARDRISNEEFESIKKELKDLMAKLE